jgi:signal transduction histidine kinase
MLSYEARSHLASIIGYTEMLLEEDGEGLIDVQRDYLQAIHDDGQYMLDQLNEL